MLPDLQSLAKRHGTLRVLQSAAEPPEPLQSSSLLEATNLCDVPLKVECVKVARGAPCFLEDGSAIILEVFAIILQVLRTSEVVPLLRTSSELVPY